jgi:hypothetical protein
VYSRIQAEGNTTIGTGSDAASPGIIQIGCEKNGKWRQCLVIQPFVSVFFFASGFAHGVSSDDQCAMAAFVADAST